MQLAQIRMPRMGSGVHAGTVLEWKKSPGQSVVKGEVLLRSAPSDGGQAEDCFHQALTVARTQGAKGWELRAATSLAKLWQSQGKTKQARDLLAPVYDWFTEGFDTADLKDAKALLAELE